MGTRNLTIVSQNGEHKVAQYGQWDGYPASRGVHILEFLKEPGKLERLKDGLKRCRFLEPDGRDKEWIESYNANSPKYMGDPDPRTDEQKYWHRTFVSRDLGSEVLDSIIDSDGECLLNNNIDFAADSLFCEWAYVIDLDKKTFEIYRGFNESPLKESDRFYGMESESEEYEPVVIVASYALDNLPGEDAFLKEVDPELEEEEAQ